MSDTVLQSNGQLGFEQRSDMSWANDKPYPKPVFFEFIRNFLFTSAYAWKYTDSCYSAVLETMEQVKSNKDSLYPEEYYKTMGMPSPAQYSAFNELYKIVEDDSFFYNHKKKMYNHARLSFFPITGLLKYIKYVKRGRVKNITIACGSFWRKNPWIREEVINYLNHFSTKHKIKIQLFTNCKKDEEGVKRLDKSIEVHHLDKRVMIHFIIIDDKYIFFEFPHSERIQLRLSMLLKLNSRVLKSKKTQLLDFFDGLTRRARALNDN